MFRPLLQKTSKLLGFLLFGAVFCVESWAGPRSLAYDRKPLETAVPSKPLLASVRFSKNMALFKDLRYLDPNSSYLADQTNVTELRQKEWQEQILGQGKSVNFRQAYIDLNREMEKRRVYGLLKPNEEALYNDQMRGLSQAVLDEMRNQKTQWGRDKLQKVTTPVIENIPTGVKVAAGVIAVAND
jgi:hypothetical protein